MSENDVPEPEPPANSEEIKENALLFDIWNVSEVEYTDPSMGRCIKTTPIAHTMGRHVSKQFQKSEISTVERLTNHLMQTGDNTGHKQKMSKIVKDAFEIVNERTGGNLMQVLVRAVENTGSREETVRLKYGSISAPQAINAAPRRRIGETLGFIVQGTLSGPYRTTATTTETLTQQLIDTADYSAQTYVISQKEEKERAAEAVR